MDEEIQGHDLLLARLTSSIVPDMVAGFGIGPDVAAEPLIVLGDNPGRIHSEAAFARLCGTNPIPAHGLG